MSRLEERTRIYGIPEIPYLPMGKNVLVFRLPNETVSAGGIFLAESAQEPKPMGVLVAAGISALEIFGDHLVEIGDIVWFARFAGYEKEIQRDPEGKGKQILQCKVDEILGSVDAIERRPKYVLGFNEEGDMVYVPANDNAVAIKRRASK